MQRSPSRLDTARRIAAGICRDALAQAFALDRGAELGRLPERLVLCPANFEVALRPGLLERGWRFVDESLVEEAGRFFEILSLAREGRLPEDEAEKRWGPFLLRRPDPLLNRYLRDTSRRQANALASARLRPAGSPLLAKLALFEEVTRRCPSWEHPQP